MSKKLFLAASMALALHTGAVLGVPAANHAWASYKERVELREQQERREAFQRNIHGQRVKLVTEAREKIRLHQFKLGEFVLKANEIDAMEAGKELDFEKARGRYNGFLKAVNEFLDHEYGIENSIYETIGGMEYYGIGDGWMAESILESGGSCVQLSHLAASLAYDSGGQGSVRLRSYPPGENGPGHLAATFLFQEGEYDFMLGDWAREGGAEIRPEQLPDLYAQKHGITVPGSRAAKRVNPIPRAQSVASRGDSFIYPAGTKTFDGNLPLFSNNAFRRPRSQDEERPDEPEPTIWDFSRLLNAAPLAFGPDSPFLQTTVIEPMPEYKLANLFTTIERTEGMLGRLSEQDVHEKVIVLGRLSALYYMAERELMLRDKQTPLRQARRRYDQAFKQGNDLLEKLGESNVRAFVDARENIHKTDDSLELWDLAFLGERGIDTLVEIAKNKQVPFLERHNSLSALLVNPASISRAEQVVRGMDGVEKGFLAMRLARMAVHYNHEESIRGPNQRSRVLVQDVVDANPGEVYRAQSAIVKTVIRYAPARRFFTIDRIFMGGEEPPNFSDLRRILGEELRAQGLGRDWEDGILFEFARMSMWPNFTGNIFLCKSSSSRFAPPGLAVDETKSALLFARDVSSWAESNGSAHPYMKALGAMSKHLASQKHMDNMDLILAHRRYWNW